MAKKDKTVRQDEVTIRTADSEATVRVPDATVTAPADSTVAVSVDATVIMPSALSDATMVVRDATMIAKNDALQVGAVADAAEYFEDGHVLLLDGLKYVIVSTLSVDSGEAIVYHVRKGERDLVLKHYKPNKVPKVKVLELVSTGKTPHVVAVEAFGQKDGRYYEVMEYATGGSMNDMLVSGGFRDLPTLKKYAFQIADGLKYLHENLGIVYQDLKPRNLLFKDKARTELIIADFGISSVLPKGAKVADLELSGTPVYAAPELSRGIGEEHARGGFAVDYFALGITLWHLWIGKLPPRERNRPIVLPPDMDESLATLVTGLLFDDPEKRFGYEEVAKWTRGEPLRLPHSADRTKIAYARYNFTDSLSYSSPEELASLMRKHPDHGLDYLFMGPIDEWLADSNDVVLRMELTKLIADDRYKANRKAAMDKALYLLDKDRLFVSHAGTECAGVDEIGDAMEKEEDHYIKAFLDPLNPVFTYIEAQDGQEFADRFREMAAIENESQKRRFYRIVLLLQSNGTGGIRLLGRQFDTLESLAACDSAKIRTEITRQLAERDSKLLVWLTERKVIGDCEELEATGAVDAFSILGAFSWLEYKKLFRNWPMRQFYDACELVEYRRFDQLADFKNYGLSFDGFPDYGRYKDMAPITFAASAGMLDMVEKLIQLGADIEQKDARGNNALCNAVLVRNVNLTKRLLDLGAKPEDPTLNGCPLDDALMCFDKDTDESRSRGITIAALLLDGGANVNFAGKDGWKPLHYFCRYGTGTDSASPELFNRMLKAGAEANAPTDQGMTPLRLLMENESLRTRLDFTRALLDGGADPNRLDNQRRNSPLMVAASQGLKDIVALMLKKGGNKASADADGKTAFHYAKAAGRKDTAKLLDPGLQLRARRLISAVTAALLTTLAFLFLVYTFGPFHPSINQLSLEAIPLGVLSYSLSLLCMSWIYLLLSGSFREYWKNLKGTFNNLEGAFAYAIVGPLLLPILVSLVHRGLDFTPRADLIESIFSTPGSLIFPVLPPVLAFPAFALLLALAAAPRLLMDGWIAETRRVYVLYKKSR